MQSFPYFIQNEFYLEVYIIGYKNQGEAILIVVEVDGRAVFCVLIDSYHCKDKNLIQEILVKKRIQWIDIICWSHPHGDHSKGMKDIIKNYSNEDTLILIPEGVELSPQKFSKEVIKLFSYLREQVVQSAEKYRVMSVSDGKNVLFYHWPKPKFIYQTQEFQLKINSFAPPSHSLRANQFLNRIDNNLNSIGFVLVLGNKYLVFTGDIENNAWSQLPPIFIKDIDLLKIPHHGSKTANKALDLFSDIDISVCTSYICGNSKLPEKEIIDCYENISAEVYLTQSMRSEENQEGYGMVKVKYNLLKSTKEVQMYGNAMQIK
ncbi:hypothetical protein [Dubosiella muris]|uniref:Uncharacterized protein n=1 Tax=Dubosiella muris TaxID=3038133 RepID=A0AC61R8L0_9FIRM|nr:hypothetical protein [Dubosiella muris]TGY66201.1 hypothetical protein E5336_04970 [Dubosiella muris]